MRSTIIILISMIAGYDSYGQDSRSWLTKIETETKYIDTLSILDDPHYRNFTYTDSSGFTVRIQNSMPRGEPYIDPIGRSFGKAIFWTRVMNESDTPIDLTINFPGNSYSIPPWPESYLRLYVLPDTMTFDKLTFYNHGAADVSPYLDTALYKPTGLHRTLQPKEESFFHIVVLSFQSGGMVRAGLVLKEEELFYRISILPHFDSALIPCGKIKIETIHNQN